MGLMSGEEAYELMKMMKQENSTLHHSLSDFNASFPRHPSASPSAPPYSSFSSCNWTGQACAHLHGTFGCIQYPPPDQTYASQPLSANPFFRFLVSIAGDDKAVEVVNRQRSNYHLSFFDST